MAALLLERLQQNKTTSFQTAVRAIELVLLSAGVVYTVLMFIGAVSSLPHNSSNDFMLSSLKNPLSSLKSWLSSSFYIYIFMNFLVMLIVVSSLLYHPKAENINNDIEDGNGDSDDYDLHTSFSPSLSPPPASPPPMQNNHKRQFHEKKPKETEAAAETIATATTNGTDHKKVGKCYHYVLSDLSGLPKGKEAQATNDGGKIRTAAKQGGSTRNTNNVARITDDDDGSLQRVFVDFSKLGEANEIIQKVHYSPDSSKQVVTLQSTLPETTTKNGHISSNERRNQLEEATKGVENEEEDDTMEATWRAINGGGKAPEKQLKKSETWAQPQALIPLPLPSMNGEVAVAGAKELSKSMTFNETVSVRSRRGLRRDPSMNLEEFNQRVETFIQKFNHEMRLQRQESDQRYLDMISRGL